MNRIIEIKDFQNPELDVYARLSEVQLLRACEPKPGLFIAESPRVIERAIQAGYYPVSFLAEKKELKGPAGELTEKFPDIPVYTAPQVKMALMYLYTFLQSTAKDSNLLMRDRP